MPCSALGDGIERRFGLLEAIPAHSPYTPEIGRFPMMTPWWQERKAELVSIVRENGPVVLYCEETLNEIVFDLLSLESVDGLFWDLGVNVHPRVLEALGRLGAGFLFRTEEEISALTTSRRPIHGDRFLKVSERWFPDRIPPETGGRAAVALSPADLDNVLRLGGGAGDFLVDLPVPATGGDAVFPENARDGLGAARELLGGAYLPWGNDVPMTRALEGVRSWEDFLDPSGMLVLGRGLGVVMDEETGRPDLDRTNVELDPLREAFPGMGIWMEPGVALVSTGGVLLIPVGRVFEEDGSVFAEVGVNTEAVISHAWARVKGRVQNLTGEATGQTRTVGLLGREDGNGSGGCLSAAMPVPEEGDVLLFSHMGVTMPGTAAGEPLGGTLKAMYLNARRICQVPL